MGTRIHACMLTLRITDKLGGPERQYHFETNDGQARECAQRHHGQLNSKLDWQNGNRDGVWYVYAETYRYTYRIAPLTITELD